MNGVLWMIVIAVAVILLIAIIVRAVAARRSRPAFDVRALPASYVSAYQARISELQAMFVDHPRESVAGAKQLVDDMTMRMGYPTRMTDRERLTDMESVERSHGERYKAGLALKPESTTEEMRRALRSYLDLARDLINRGESADGAEEGRRPEIAG
jgi:hypothetical protein